MKVIDHENISRLSRIARTGLLLCALVITSGLIALHNSQPTRAESFFDSFRCWMSGISRQDCAAKTSSPPATKKEATSEAQTTNPGQPAQRSGSSLGPLEPVEFNAALAEPLPQRAAAPQRSVMSSSAQDTRTVASVAYVGLSPKIVETAERAPLRTSENGWVLLSIAWYWWVAGMVAALLIITVVRSRKFKPRFSIVTTRKK